MRIGFSPPPRVFFFMFIVFLFFNSVELTEDIPHYSSFLTLFPVFRAQEPPGAKRAWESSISSSAQII